jgi:hypothetical protein
MFDSWLYITVEIIILLLFLFGLLQLWFWADKQKDIKEAKKVVKELTENNTPKLDKEEQFDLIDYEDSWRMRRKILGEKYNSMHVLEYFIDIQPDEYLEHLRKHNPPFSWSEGTYGEAEIKKTDNNHYQIIYYDHGKKSSTKIFQDYDKLLRFIVFQRLTNIGYKYKKLIKENYYA